MCVCVCVNEMRYVGYLFKQVIGARENEGDRVVLLCCVLHTVEPSEHPTESPTQSPSVSPSQSPSMNPSASPSGMHATSFVCRCVDSFVDKVCVCV